MIAPIVLTLAVMYTGGYTLAVTIVLFYAASKDPDPSATLAEKFLTNLRDFFGAKGSFCIAKRRVKTL